MNAPMNAERITLFLPCAAGAEDFLADEVHGITALSGQSLLVLRGGVRVRADWATMQRLNLQSRLAQRVLLEVAHAPCRDEHDLYHLASAVAWEDWFGAHQSFRVDLTAQASALRSLNFATLRVKDAVADRFRARAGGVRPSIDTHAPEVRIAAHLAGESATLYIDTSGEPLFKRGWRQDKGDAPLKETLAAAMLAACGWWQPATRTVLPLPLYDPCCGSGTIVVEAAQILLGLPPGAQRRFAFERLRPQQSPQHAADWQRLRQETIKTEAQTARRMCANAGFDAQGQPRIFGSDVAHRMVDFAQRNAQRAGVAQAVALRGGDALQRMPPTAQAGVLLMNPPYGERIAAAGVAASRAGRQRGMQGRQAFQSDAPGAQQARQMHAGGSGGAGGGGAGDEFFARLAAHWKSHYGGWTAWLLTPDAQLPARLRLKATRRVPMWNGPIECRLLRFDLTARQAAGQPAKGDVHGGAQGGVHGGAQGGTEGGGQPHAA